MTDISAIVKTDFHRGEEANKRLKKRYAQESRFRTLGLGAILLALGALAWLLITVVGTGATILFQNEITLDVKLDKEVIDPDGTGDPVVIRGATYTPLLLEAVIQRFPAVRSEYEKTLSEEQESSGFVKEMDGEIAKFSDKLGAFEDELLALMEVPEAVEELQEFVLDDIDNLGDVVTVSLPGSDALTALAGGGSADLTASQRAVAEGLLRRGAVDTSSGSTLVNVEVELAYRYLDPRHSDEEEVIEKADFGHLLARSLAAYAIDVSTAFYTAEQKLDGAKKQRSDASGRARRLRRDRIELGDEILEIVSTAGGNKALRDIATKDPAKIGETVTIEVPVADDIDQLIKGYIERDVPEEQRIISDRQIAWVDELREKGEIKAAFNSRFFQNADSQDAEVAGVASALMGSFLALVVTFLLSFPVGVAAAIYLEEFAPKNPWTDLIEVNINNLAAVPSIVFGLLGLAIFLNFFNLPRSAPLVGGMVLALMTLPTIIIATRAALKAVPPSIREGALGVGASPVQAVFHHVLPLAMPGILTGTIIGMAQALGETAPLLMIGMVAFVTEIPSSFTEPAAALPVQIFLWADRPERAFVERTSAAIMVLLGFLIMMNLIAIFLRRRFERRW